MNCREKEPRAVVRRAVGNKKSGEEGDDSLQHGDRAVDTGRRDNMAVKTKSEQQRRRMIINGGVKGMGGTVPHCCRPRRVKGMISRGGNQKNNDCRIRRERKTKVIAMGGGKI